MKKTMAKVSLFIMVAFYILGFFLIFASSSIGERMGNKALTEAGGVMDTGQYERIIETNTTSFKLVGSIVSLVGGFGLVLSGYALYKEL